MIWDEQANVFKGIIYKVKKEYSEYALGRPIAKPGQIEYCTFSEASRGDETMSGSVLEELTTSSYLLAKFISSGGIVGSFAILKDVIKVDSRNLVPAEGRSLFKALLRGL